jgi:hypothetical protein
MACFVLPCVPCASTQRSERARGKFGFYAKAGRAVSRRDAEVAGKTCNLVKSTLPSRESGNPGLKNKSPFQGAFSMPDQPNRPTYALLVSASPPDSFCFPGFKIFSAFPACRVGAASEDGRLCERLHLRPWCCEAATHHCFSLLRVSAFSAVKTGLLRHKA